MPTRPFSSDKEKFAAHLLPSHKGSAGGPSGMTNEHLRSLLDNHCGLHLFFRVSELLARGGVPESVVSVLRRGRMTVPGGGGPRHCGRRCGEAFGRKNQVPTVGSWRLRVPQHFFQYALSTRAGCDLQALADLDTESTIFSIDGI